MTDNATDDLDVEQLTKIFAEVDADLSDADGEALLRAATQLAVSRVPGTEWASVTLVARDGGFTTAASTDERAAAADQVQYDLGTGPCVDATADQAVYCPEDLAQDDRWPQLGSALHERFGVNSMLAVRLTVDGGGLVGALNQYSTRPGAFDATSVLVAQVIATRVAMAASIARRDTAIEQLQAAKMSNRDIGVAMGVLMSRYHVTRDEAFDLLRLASQNTNRKLRDVAEGVVEVGDLIIPERA